MKFFSNGTFRPHMAPLALVATLLFASLLLTPTPVRAGGKKGKTISKKPAESFNEIYFKKLKDYKIRLTCFSRNRFFSAGDFAKLTFVLKNTGNKDLVVYEWFEREPDNIRIYYHVWEKGMDAPPLKEFKELAPSIGKKPKRMTLELRPKTSVVVDKLLTFIRILNVEKPVSFILFAELNLKSISARSEFIKIVVLPRGKKSTTQKP
jgi:hypothetical protein